MHINRYIYVKNRAENAVGVKRNVMVSPVASILGDEGTGHHKEIGVDVALISMASKVSAYCVHLYILYCLFTQI